MTDKENAFGGGTEGVSNNPSGQGAVHLYGSTTGTPVQRVLERLQSVKPAGDRRWIALCPAHGDKHPSLSVKEADDGKVLLKCFSANCTPDDIAKAIGLTLSDLFTEHTRARCSGNRRNSATPATSKRENVEPDAQEVLQHSVQHSATPATLGDGHTLTEYATAKRLPLETLQAFGLTDYKRSGSPAVRIPYFDSDGNESAVRYRIAMSGDKFRWKMGAKPCLYGLNRLEEARAAGSVAIAIVEGESDCHTLWHHGIPAVGLPGATNWREARDAVHLDGIGCIYIVYEPDAGGDAVKRWLSVSSIRERVMLVNLQAATGFKDPSALHLDEPERFTERWQAALATARPFVDVAREDAEQAERKAFAEAEPLATLPDILSTFGGAVKQAGLVGEQRNAKLLYLALTSRVLEKPVSMVLKGRASGGKNWTAGKVLAFFPPSAVYELSGASALALNFSEEPLAHRFLYFAEAAGLGERDSKLNAMLRTLMSENQLVYEVAHQRQDGTYTTQRMEKEGPTGFLTTTTAETLHPENETRFFSLTIDDTKAQTAAIIAATFDETPREVDFTPWHALQEWLSTAENRVTIPYGRTLAENIGAVDVRLRRDITAIKGLLRAHAVLHQRSRERDAQSRIIATLADYEAVYALVSDVLSEGVAATVHPTIRDTVGAVAALKRGSDGGVSCTAVANRLDIDKATASRRLRVASRAGYVVNNETLRGKPARYAIGEPMPEDTPILPTPETLAELLRVLQGVASSVALPSEREGLKTDAQDEGVLQCCAENGKASDVCVPSIELDAGLLAHLQTVGIGDVFADGDDEPDEGESEYFFEDGKKYIYLNGRKALVL